jgi:hypothetical protein
MMHRVGIPDNCDGIKLKCLVRMLEGNEKVAGISERYISSQARLATPGLNSRVQPAGYTLSLVLTPHLFLQTAGEGLRWTLASIGPPGVTDASFLQPSCRVSLRLQGVETDINIDTWRTL